MIGQTVSHYRIIEELGAGAMGVVYVAEDTHLARKVAIKFLSSQDQSQRARFLREARAVSHLNHRNIASVFDYGETNRGQPYIVMELIQGRTLDELLDARSLTLARSVEIVADIAAALAEAHRLGIVHRDVKPSNVIISERGVVKVLDFGLVKQFDDAGIEAPALASKMTRSDVILGTPLYLSPEQATGKQVDGRSDVFALGAVLYECLTGQSAFSGASLIEIGVQILQVNPPPPSSIDPGIPPQLDHVTLKALEKEPEARYQTADEMAAELNAVLPSLDPNARPILRPPTQARSGSSTSHVSALTTLAESLRRPRHSVFTLLIAIAVTGAAITGAMYWWRPRPHQPSGQALDLYKRGTDELRNGAFFHASKLLTEAIKTDDKFALAHARLAEALAELDNSDQSKTEMLRANTLVSDRSLLPRADALSMEAINATLLGDFPAAIRAYSENAQLSRDDPQVHVDLGRAFERNDEMDKAIEEYVRATSLDGEYATAYLLAGSGYSRKGQVPAAATAFDKAETLFKTRGNAEGVTEVFRRRGVLFRNLGKFNEAAAQFEQAYDTAHAAGNDSQQIEALLELSILSFNRDDNAKAQDYAHRAIEFAQQKGLENLATSGLINLGLAFLGKSDYAKAEECLKPALEFARRNKARRREAEAAMNLASAYLQQYRADEALPLLQQALTFFRQGDYRSKLSVGLSLLGRAFRQKGDYDAALKAVEEELQIAQQAGAQPQIAFAHGEIGAVLSERESYAEALEHYDESLAINRALDHKLYIAYNQENRGNLLWRLGRYSEAEQALTEALASDDDPLTPNVQLAYAQMALSRLNFTQAAARATKALELSESKYVVVTAEARGILGLAKVFSGSKREGVHLCQEALKLANSIGDSLVISRTMLALAEAKLAAGDTETGLDIASQSVERFARAGQLESEARSLLIASRCQQRLNNQAAAEKYSEAAKILLQFEQKLGEDALRTYLARPDIQVLRRQLGHV